MGLTTNLSWLAGFQPSTVWVSPWPIMMESEQATIVGHLNVQYVVLFQALHYHLTRRDFQLWRFSGFKCRALYKAPKSEIRFALWKEIKP